MPHSPFSTTHTQQQTADLPIGLFDSGVGGLTVLKALRHRLPCETFLYLGDTARLPYGTKSAETITRYALQASEKLVERGIKLLVIACNTASSVALKALQQAYPHIPVIGVVEPGAQASCRATTKGHIAVIATESTIRGGAYQAAIHKINPKARIVAQPTPVFVTLAEEGWCDGDITEGVAARYLTPLFNPASGTDSPQTPDSLVLGCTHFPLLASAIRNVIGPDIAIVDSAETTADEVNTTLIQKKMLRHAEHCGNIQFLTTDDAARFARTGSRFLGLPISEQDVELVDL